MFEPTGSEQTQMTIVDIELASVDYGATFTRRLPTQYKDYNPSSVYVRAEPDA